MIQPRQIQRLLVALLTPVVVVSCGVTDNSVFEASESTTATTDCRTVEHQMGETQVCGQPQKIVVLGPYILELLLALDLQPSGFADHVSMHQGDYTNPSQQIPYLGDRVTTEPVNVGLAYTPSIEAILKVQPDLILGTKGNNEGQYEQLSQIAPTLLLERFDAGTSLQTIARAVERSERAEELLARSKQEIETARQALAPVTQAHPNMLMLISSGDDSGQFALITGKRSLCGSLIEELGFQLVYPPEIDEEGLNTPPMISQETLPQFNRADSVILFGYNWDTKFEGTNTFEEDQLKNLKQGWQENAIAQSLDASQADRVYFIPAYLCLGLPGPIGTKLYLEELKRQLSPSI